MSADISYQTRLKANNNGGEEKLHQSSVLLTLVLNLRKAGVPPNPSNKELIELYTPSEAEIRLATSKTRSYDGQFSFLVMLKTFQRLGY